MDNRKFGIRNNRSKKPFRKQLRNSGTPAEAVLWTHLKNRQCLGKKFRRQESIYRYIVDFYCPKSRLIVELDGERHFSITLDEYEEERTRYLEGLGLKVIRFENGEIFENIEGVLERIREGLIRQGS